MLWRNLKQALILVWICNNSMLGWLRTGTLELQHYFAVWSQTSYLAFLCLSFLSLKWGNHSLYLKDLLYGLHVCKALRIAFALCSISFHYLRIYWALSRSEEFLCGFFFFFLLIRSDSLKRFFFNLFFGCAGSSSLQLMGSVVAAHWHVGSSWTRDWTCVPCIGRWIL